MLYPLKGSTTSDMLQLLGTQGDKYSKLWCVDDAKAKNVGLRQLQYSPTVLVSTVPPWLLPSPSVDFSIQQELKGEAKQILAWRIVQNYLDKKFSDSALYFHPSTSLV